jgi:hypothetical protein
MEKSNKRLLESEVNALLAEQMQGSGWLVLRQVRLHPCELDIVLFDPGTLRLAILEIKRSNWKGLLAQALRARLYCHFSIAVLPAALRSQATVDEFESRGIGLLFYEETKDGLILSVASTPLISDVMNRPLKQLLYQRFHAKYGDLVYA